MEAPAAPTELPELEPGRVWKSSISFAELSRSYGRRPLDDAVFSCARAAVLRGDRAKDRANHQRRRTPPTEPRQPQNRFVAGVLGVELAGLEPATSWVRFGRPVPPNPPDLQRFCSCAGRLVGLKCPGFAGDSRELRPQDHACGLNACVHMPGAEQVARKGRGGRGSFRSRRRAALPPCAPAPRPLRQPGTAGKGCSHLGRERKRRPSGA
jgi:hypothetical protein